MDPDGPTERVDGFGDDNLVYARVEQGVWRELCVVYGQIGGDQAVHPCAVFDDKRCAHVHAVQLNHIDARIDDKLARLANLAELTYHPCFDYGFALPPGVWPRLRALTVDCISTPIRDAAVADQMVLSLVAAAPNLRGLRIKWTYGLHCLPAILAGLPMLEALMLHYANDDDTRALADCKQLDTITPPMLVSVRLCKKLADGGKDNTDSLGELAATLVRMQQRAPNHFSVELGCKRF